MAFTALFGITHITQTLQRSLCASAWAPLDQYAAGWSEEVLSKALKSSLINAEGHRPNSFCSSLARSLSLRNLPTWRTESDTIKGLFESFFFLCLKVQGQNIYSDTCVSDKRAWGESLAETCKSALWYWVFKFIVAQLLQISVKVKLDKIWGTASHTDM